MYVFQLGNNYYVFVVIAENAAAARALAFKCAVQRGLKDPDSWKLPTLSTCDYGCPFDRDYQLRSRACGAAPAQPNSVQSIFCRETLKAI